MGRGWRFSCYLVTCKTTGKQYVGITAYSAAERWLDHLSCANRKIGYYLHKAIRKYGAENFIIECVAMSRAWSDACETEKSLIAQYGTFLPGGYNLTLGGEGAFGYRASDAVRAKMSASRKGKPIPPETRAKISASLRTSEQFARMSAKSKGRKLSEAQCRRMSESTIGHTVTPETRAKISLSRKGVPLSKAHCEKLREAHSNDKRRTRCSRGHELTDDNVRWQVGGKNRYCLRCRQEATRLACARRNERLKRERAMRKLANGAQLSLSI